jgi:hypothetical protein
MIDRVRSQLESLQRVTDAALAYLSEDELLAALLDRIIVVPEGSHVRRVLEITGLDRAVPTHATLEAALARARA